MLLTLAASLFLAQQSAPDGPPEVRELPKADPYLRCRCSEDAEDDLISVTGVVKDARFTLAPGGKRVIDRQETIFEVIRASEAGIDGEVAIAHPIKPESCGVSFDYGRQYTVMVRKVEGELETDWCIDPRRG
jgi:hypothetical protein